MAGVRLYPIGRTECGDGRFVLKLDPKYKDALKGLDGFSHVLVLMWFDGCDNDAGRSNLVERKPYKGGPDELGVFATRSPARPNPIAVSVAGLAKVDMESATVELEYIDAMDGTPVLDIKPYIPGADRVMEAKVPEWQQGWPSSYEESGDFDWSRVFDF